MLWEHRTDCPDCQETLNDIKIVDATGRALDSGISHVELSFASPSAGQSTYTGTIHVAGTVKAKLCSGCGRIFLYALNRSGGLPREE
jgi:hypothetical protein